MITRPKNNKDEEIEKVYCIFEDDPVYKIFVSEVSHYCFIMGCYSYLQDAIKAISETSDSENAVFTIVEDSFIVD